MKPALMPTPTLYAVSLVLSAVPLWAADLTLLRDGSSDYQIVIPDRQDTPAMAACLDQTARLLQTAFQANGAAIRVVPESRREAARPSLWLGNTDFARKQGIDVHGLPNWSYVLRAVGRDIVIAGHDHAAKAGPGIAGQRNWDRVGTAKAAADFARQFMGVRFLYPEVPPYATVGDAAKIDLLASPAIEFLPRKTIVVPGDLNVVQTPRLRVNTSHPPGRPPARTGRTSA